MTNCEEELRLAKERIKQLEENEIAFPFRLWLALEEILDKDKGFYHPDNLELNVYDNDFEINKTISVNPKDLICITTAKDTESKGNTRRKKLLFIKSTSADSYNKIRTYTLNSNDYNFEKLCNQLDPLSHYLLVVSKGAIANVKFYDLANNNGLIINLKSDFPDEIKCIALPSSKNHSLTIENFNKIKEAYDYKILLQKKVFGYKYSIGIDD